MNELKPCPFCGNEAFLEVDKDHHGKFANLGCIVPSCPAHRIYYTVDVSETSIEELISNWNTRPIEDALRAELEKTQKALEKACKYNATYLHECPHEDCPQPKTVDCIACWKAYFMGGNR